MNKKYLTRPIAAQEGYKIESRSQKRDRLAKDKAEDTIKSKIVDTSVARTYHSGVYFDDGKDHTPLMTHRSRL